MEPAPVSRPETVTEMEAEEEPDFCVICFEPGSFVELPCKCQLKYCMACWDRALATSVVMRGKPQCPSCRTAFQVDFDAAKGTLVCSADATGTTSADWRSRLYAKARPAQIERLRTYGKEVAMQCKENCEKGKGSSGSSSSASASASSEAWSESADPAPKCVCGSVLECLSPRGRILRMLEEHDPSWRSHIQEAECVITKLVDSALVTCDLCDKDATRTGAVWTCKRGQHTLLHPAAYDVCEKCFAKFAGLGATSSAGQAGSQQGCATMYSSSTWRWLKRTTVGAWLGACSNPQFVNA